MVPSSSSCFLSSRMLENCKTGGVGQGAPGRRADGTLAPDCPRPRTSVAGFVLGRGGVAGDRQDPWGSKRRSQGAGGEG